MSVQNTSYATNNSGQQTSIGEKIESGLEQLESGIENVVGKIGNVFKSKSDDLMELYKKRDFKALAQKNLKTPVDNLGNTIVSVMAANLDKEAFEAIRAANPKALSYDVINTPNNKQDLPIHVALETIKKNNSDDSFINYMISLGAKTNIPNSQNKIIVKNTTQVTQTNDKSKEKLKQLNEQVINNINTLNRLAGSNTSANTCAISSKDLGTESGKNENLQFIKQLKNYYADATIVDASQQQPKSTQAGGYNGRRRIKSYIPDFTETGENDSFVAKRKNQLLNDKVMTSQDRTKRNKQTKKTENSNMNDSDTTDNKNSQNKSVNRFAGGDDDDDEDRLENVIDDQTSDYRTSDMNLTSDLADTATSDFDEELIGGNRNTSKKGSTNTRSKSSGKKGSTNSRTKSLSRKDLADIKNFEDEWQTEEFDLFPSSKDRLASANDRLASANDRTTSNSRKSSNKSRDENTNVSSYDYDDDIFSSQDRPKIERDVKADEMYKSFIQKIMDLLGVDEETAKFYRSAIKITIGKNNPELRKRENDALRVKEMEKIMESKKKLQDALAEIKLEEIKVYMAEQKEAADRRREEWEKTKGDRNKGKRTTSEDDEAPKRKRTTTEDTEAPKERPKRTKKTTKVAENGYLQSDEILFSPDH